MGYLIAILVWIASCAGSAWFGWDYRDGKAAQESLVIAKAYYAWAEENQGRADRLAAELAAARSIQAPKDRAITKEVIRYAQVTPSSQRCTLPGTWRLRHDAAATGMPIDAATANAGPLGAGAAAPIKDAAALETIDNNYREARDCADKLRYWQRRYHEVERGGKK